MKIARSAMAVAAVVVFGSTGIIRAGSYGPQPFNYPSGSINLGDGSSISSSTNVTSIQNVSGDPCLRLTRNGTGDTSSSFKLPDLDPGNGIESFEATFRVLMASTGSPADGFSFNIGEIEDGDGGGENGFAMPGGMFVAFDTYSNGDGDPTSIEVFADGISIADRPRDWGATFGTWTPVTIRWDAAGLDIVYAGEAIVTNLPTPGFQPGPGDRFAFSGRTGGLTQDTFIDDLTVTTETGEPTSTGGLAITEFMADNNDTLEDEDLDSPDWVEIYNGQATPVSLAGHFLTNDPANPTLWPLPAIELPGYAYLVIRASGKDRRDPDGVLHANFTLQREGGYLALTGAGGASVLTEFDYGPQAEDVSFGELGSARTLGYLESPTPGAENAGLQAPGPPAETVDFLQAGGLFTSPFSLAIAPPASPEAVIRYTLNNTVPTEASDAYSAPIAISATTTVRARIFEPGRLPGAVRSRTFLRLASDVAGFSSDLPIIVADSSGVNIDAASNPAAARPYRPVYTVALEVDPTTGRAAMNGLPDFTGRGGMHVRGQSSSGFPKKQYAWETWNNRNEDDDVSILGFPSESDWILQAPYSDKTLMRNKLVYDVARDLHGNQGAVRTRFVELFFNQDGGSVSMADYRGVYVFMEKIKRDGDRIDIDRLNDLVTDPEQITGGYIFKKDKGPYAMPWTTSRGIPLDMHEPESPSDVQFSWLRNHINAFESALYGAGFDDPATGYAAYIDPLTFIDTHLFVEVFKEIDGYRISSYFTKPRGGRIRSLPVWDYNLALGNANYLNGQNPVGWYYPQIGGSDYPWYPRLFQDPEFVLRYWDRYWQLRGNLFDGASLAARIDAYTDDLAEAQARNFDQWDILGEYVWPNADGYQSRTTHQAEVDWMKNWLSQRLAWIDTQSEGFGGDATPPDFSRDGGQVPAGAALTLSHANAWPGATIYYTTDGTDPRIPSTAGAGDETILVGESAPCSVLVPSVENGGAALTAAQWTDVAPPPNQASWRSGVQGVGYERSSSGTYDPFLGTDVEGEMFVANTTAYIRIPFTVASQAVIDSFSALTLRIRYDDSFVAYLNGQEVARDESRTPAPLAWNSEATSLRPDDEAVEFLDIDLTPHLGKLRVGANILALHGLNDGVGSSDALWQCELVGGSGSPNGPSGSAIAYTGPITLANSVEIRARVSDGSRWSPLRAETFVVAAPPASAENVVVSEIHYRPAAPSPEEVGAGFTSRGDFEFIEIMNISGGRIDLTDAAFTTGIAFAFDPSLPPNALDLPPGGRIVLVRNRAAFEMRYGSGAAAAVAGTFTGALDNAGESLALTAASGLPIKAFTYDNRHPWPEAPDGDGFSLVLVDPESNPDHDDPANWRPSVLPGGTPGGTDAVTFSGDPDADDDGDGQSAFLEFAHGTRDDSAASRSTLSSGPELHDPDGTGVPREYLVFEFQRNLAADQVIFSIESSEDGAGWDASAGEWVALPPVMNGDGTQRLKFRSAVPWDELPPRLLVRLRVSQ